MGDTEEKQENKKQEKKFKAFSSNIIALGLNSLDSFPLQTLNKTVWHAGQHVRTENRPPKPREQDKTGIEKIQ